MEVHYPYTTECTYKLQPHSQALDWELGVRLVNYAVQRLIQSRCIE